MAGGKRRAWFRSVWAARLSTSGIRGQRRLPQLLPERIGIRNELYGQTETFPRRPEHKQELFQR